MRALILADLHLDSWSEAKRDPLAGLEEDLASLDLLILAGDLSNKPKIRWTPYLKRIADLVPPERIHVFPGNHDFYQFRLDEEYRLAEFAGAAGAQYANMREIKAGYVRFLCATLWTDHELGRGRRENEYHLPEKMNCYKAIRLASGGYRRTLPRDLVQRHIAQRDWIRDRLAVPFAGCSIVVTHHAPHPGVLADHPDEVEGAYASDLEAMILDAKPDEWLFGHCHDARDIAVGTTALRNVSLGYPSEVTDPATRIRSLIRTF